MAGGRRAALLVAAASAVSLLCAWALTVHFNREGRWSALYCHGTVQSLPPEIAAEHPYRFPGTGFDGQYYHLIAHDPLFRRGFERYVDDPRLRYRRGLLPLAAHLLAFGDDGWVHVTYPALVLASAAAGAWWLALLAMAAGRSAAWGLAFVLLPGSIASFDRLTPDVALIALMAGFLVAEHTRSEKLLWAVLILAPLVRETGVLLLAGAVVARAAREGILRASRLLIALAPFLIWVAFVHAHAAPQPYERSLLPMSAIVGALLEPRPYAGRPPGTVLAHQVADAVAVLGMVWAFVMTLLGIRRWREEGQATALLFVAMGLVLQRRDHWDHVFDFGRVYSPVLLVLLRDGLTGRTRLSLAVLPSVLVLTRVATQLASQVHGVVAGLLGSSGRGM